MKGVFHHDKDWDFVLSGKSLKSLKSIWLVLVLERSTWQHCGRWNGCGQVWRQQDSLESCCNSPDEA